MTRRFHIQATALLTALLIVLFTAVAYADDAETAEKFAQWERLEHERSSLVGQLGDLEEEHQKSVEAIEKLKAAYEAGDASRGDLEDELRDNHRTVESLEQLQSDLRDVDARQTRLRSRILDALDERRDNLEQQLREADADDRQEVLDELNDVQRQRSEFALPIPETDQRRVDAAVADARAVADGHPREMLAAADELEDTEQQLSDRLQALEQRIDQLERARAIQRQSRQFGEFDRFFDESDRSRTIAEQQQAVGADPQQDQDDDSDLATIPRQPPDEIRDNVEEPTGGQDDYAPQDANADDNAMEDGTEGEEDDYVGSDPSSDPSDPGGADGDEPGDDPFDDSEDTETVTIESDTDPATGDDTSYFSDRALQEDIERLRQERESLEQQAEELRRKSEQLREDAEEAY